MNNFLFMGGYAPYIWPAYAVAALGLIGITMTSMIRLRKMRREDATLSREE